ncbi:glycosyltransferase [Chaetomidium leptoderma]|uniref:Glycosyltransferase n=1 Tax=Chaetomidium leptoderma TaxID=669021 RepID=A0AAN6VD39_9PEZI|nr:glycosyltransferase [Chaetomidium leptoderma]
MDAHRFLAARKLSRSFVLAVLFLAFFFPLLVYSSWRPSELWGNKFSARPAQTAPTTQTAEPAPTHPRIPKKLWYKLGPKGLNDQTRAWTDGCIRNNTDYEVEFMTESSADRYVQRTFGPSDPGLVEIYLGLTVPILKADLLRYLLLFAEGGVYSDLDVSCEAPINEWIPRQYQANASLVVGWEFDVIVDRDSFVHQLETWVIMARPGSPHVWMVIRDTLQFLRDTMRERSVPIEGVALDMIGDVVDATGPRRFTRGVLKSMAEAFDTKAHDVEGLLEPKLVGDVLFLPGYAFSASANKYQEDMEVPPPLAKHHYAGTWKNDQGGETS